MKCSSAAIGIAERVSSREKFLQAKVTIRLVMYRGERVIFHIKDKPTYRVSLLVGAGLL